MEGNHHMGFESDSYACADVFQLSKSTLFASDAQSVNSFQFANNFQYDRAQTSRLHKQLTHDNPFSDCGINLLKRMPEIRKMPVSAAEYAYHQRVIDNMRQHMVDVFKQGHNTSEPASNLTFSAWL
jgi:type VI protein secretion system component VasF